MDLRTAFYGGWAIHAAREADAAQRRLQECNRRPRRAFWFKQRALWLVVAAYCRRELR